MFGIFFIFSATYIAATATLAFGAKKAPPFTQRDLHSSHDYLRGAGQVERPAGDQRDLHSSHGYRPCRDHGPVRARASTTYIAATATRQLRRFRRGP